MCVSSISDVIFFVYSVVLLSLFFYSYLEPLDVSIFFSFDLLINTFLQHGLSRHHLDYERKNVTSDDDSYEHSDAVMKKGHIVTSGFKIKPSANYMYVRI